MKKLCAFLSLFFIILSSNTFAQDKKVAVVTFYVIKKIAVSEFGSTANLAVENLCNDSAFNMEPLLKDFHTQFFDDYSKNFPFQLLAEDEVVNNAAYKAYVPIGETGTGLLKDTYNVAYDGYKIVLPLVGHENERNLLSIFNQCDGVMKVYIDFDLVKIGFGGMGVVKVNAHANIALFNKNGDKVFSVREDAKSKSVSPMVEGVPVMTTEKILPMCVNAMEQLMVALQKDLPKMIKKADAKL